MASEGLKCSKKVQLW